MNDLYITLHMLPVYTVVIISIYFVYNYMQYSKATKSEQQVCYTLIEFSGFHWTAEELQPLIYTHPSQTHSESGRGFNLQLSLINVN